MPSTEYIRSETPGGTGGFSPIVGSFYTESKDWAAPPPVADPTPGSGGALISYGSAKKASPSIFNRYSIFFFNNTQSGANTPEDYFDNATRRPIGTADQRLQSVVNNPTAKQLIKWSREAKTNAMEFDWSDFLWCKDYGVVPNNYMVTLRRFPGPCADDLFDNNTDPGTARNPSPDVARMITWVDGEDNKWDDVGLKFNHGMTWKKLEAKIQEVAYQDTGAFGNEGQGLAGSNSGIVRGIGGSVKALSAATQEGFGRRNLENPAADNFNPYKDENTVYGPVDIIKEMLIRDAGLNFEQEFKLTFNYELKSIDGINPKIAFIDLLSNVMLCTANRGSFWGGEIRHYGGHARRIKPLGDPYKLQGGDVAGYFKSLLGGILGRLTDLTGGQGFSLDGLGNAAKTIGSNLLGNVLGNALDGMGRPGIVGLNSLLTGEDTGEWHVTVGNPTNPIIMVGNLVLDDTELELYGPLGADDFPTKIKVVCTLKPARPRDRSDILAMFSRNGRTYLTEPPAAARYAGNLVKGGQSPNAQFASATDAPTVAGSYSPPTGNPSVNRFPNHNDPGVLLNAAKLVR